MSVLKNFCDDELVISCDCGCDEGVHFKIEKLDDDDFAMFCFTNGKFYAEQEHGFLAKLKKIWAILRNKDYYYSDIRMSKKDFELFRDWVNKIHE